MLISRYQVQHESASYWSYWGMVEGFKAYEKHFKKFETSEAAVKEGKAIDFYSNAGYTHVCDIKFDGKMCR